MNNWQGPDSPGGGEKTSWQEGGKWAERSSPASPVPRPEEFPSGARTFRRHACSPVAGCVNSNRNSRPRTKRGHADVARPGQRHPTSLPEAGRTAGRIAKNTAKAHRGQGMRIAARESPSFFPDFRGSLYSNPSMCATERPPVVVRCRVWTLRRGIVALGHVRKIPREGRPCQRRWKQTRIRTERSFCF